MILAMGAAVAVFMSYLTNQFLKGRVFKSGFLSVPTLPLRGGAATDLILHDLRDLFGENLAVVLCCEKLKMFSGQNLQEKKEDRQTAGPRKKRLRKTSPRLGFLCRAWLILLPAAIFLIPSAPGWAGHTLSERVTFQRSIVDKRSELNRRYKKIPRKKTKYIIVHTSEAGLKSTLNSVLKGKRVRRERTYGGHAHYVIARNGRAYRILDKRYIADHAGTSMWKGETDISKVSLAIELVGYHYTSATKQQYRSIGILIDILCGAYGLNDRAVLTHSQIAYGKPNRWVRAYHRGRKKCAKNFDRSKAGLGSTWPYDPDVRAGRLKADHKLAAIFYEPRKNEALLIGSNTITPSNSAWSIAGEDYDDPDTLYRLPNGRVVPGDEIENRIGWSRLPEKTVVLLNQ